ncbi:hypothetical protein KPH14_009361 [Odynerus spinipes]|uniref:MARVEL domain-containing protein n=1 Tax=Odynerus spinipes TaxID=1348599 RepID=A0AAD9VQU7_9HYME|nr:hypothetical protein KPH14_009361 [Odynerus spinipes]
MLRRKRVKYPTGWTLLDENIENVERVCLDPKTQRELCCTVGEYVFLEYPWVCVPRDDVLRHANEVGSCFEAYREKISVYDGPTFLLGYNSTELTSDKFVICLTEKAKEAIFQRNKNISKAILNGVRQQLERTPRSWKSLGSEEDMESSAENTREFFEIEIVLPATLLGSDRQLSDRNSTGCRDSYVELVPDDETFDNVDMLLVTRATQTHLLPKENSVQTYPGNPRNSWTQYVYEDTLNGKLPDTEDIEDVEESRDEAEQDDEEKDDSGEENKPEVNESEEETREKEPIELFLEKRSQEMIDEIKYNSVVNLYVDDVESLLKDEHETIKSSETPICTEYRSFIALNLTKGSTISDVSWHPTLMDYVAVSYVKTADPDAMATLDSSPGALLWSLSNAFRPRSYLRSNEDVHCISFCPMRDDVVVGGCENGQIVIWSIPFETIDLADSSDVAVVNVDTTSTEDQSQRLPIRKIRWIPAKYKVEPSRQLVESSNQSFTQFMTASMDGTIVIWTLDISSSRLLTDSLQATYKLSVKMPNTSRNFTLLSMSVSSESLQEEYDVHREVNESSRKEEEHTKRLWLGTAEGELMRCTWEGQMFDTEPSDSEELTFLDRSYAHDGPVIEIVRCHRLLDIVLTIGGHILAIWNENYFESPIFWRRSPFFYTACCWCDQPGVFLIGRHDGELEVWDIKRKNGEPVLVRTISDGPITVLSFWKQTDESSGLIGVADSKGIFRVFREPAKYSDDLERMDWLEEYIWREVRRKKVFSTWQSEYLRTDPTAIARRRAKDDEVRRKRQEKTRENLQREMEERSRLEAERRARATPKSKDTLWKWKEHERMKSALLKQKGLVPEELEMRRLPLIRLEEERREKLQKVEREAAFRGKHYQDIATIQFDEFSDSSEEKTKTVEEEEEEKEIDTNVKKYMEQYCNIRDEVRRILGIICMACVSPAWVAASHWFLFVATTAFISTIMWCFVYLLSIREALKLPINWILTELLNTSIEAVLYTIAFIVQLSKWAASSGGVHVGANIAGGVFGILNTLAYAAGAYFLYIEWKSSNTQ